MLVPLGMFTLLCAAIVPPFAMLLNSVNVPLVRLLIVMNVYCGQYTLGRSAVAAALAVGRALSIIVLAGHGGECSPGGHADWNEIGVSRRERTADVVRTIMHLTV